jgi:hypothetical protein
MGNFSQPTASIAHCVVGDGALRIICEYTVIGDHLFSLFASHPFISRFLPVRVTKYTPDQQ